MLCFIFCKVSAESLAQHDFKFSGIKNISIHNGVTHAQVFVPQECFTASMGKRFQFLIQILIQIETEKLTHHSRLSFSNYSFHYLLNLATLPLDEQNV